MAARVKALLELIVNEALVDASAPFANKLTPAALAKSILVALVTFTRNALVAATSPLAATPSHEPADNTSTLVVKGVVAYV